MVYVGQFDNVNGAPCGIHEHVADGSSVSFCGVTFLFVSTLFNSNLHYFRFFIILDWIILVVAVGVAMLI